MAEKEIEERAPIPPRPEKRKDWPEYFEQNKEAIIVDYRSMTIREFFKRGSMATTTWPKLKERWGVEGKRKFESLKPAKTPGEYKEPWPKPGKFYISITEEDLARLDDDDFRLCWVILGRVIKNRLSKTPI